VRRPLFHDASASQSRTREARESQLQTYRLLALAPSGDGNLPGSDRRQYSRAAPGPVIRSPAILLPDWRAISP
jgi:hypothetical protein